MKSIFFNFLACLVLISFSQSAHATNTGGGDPIADFVTPCLNTLGAVVKVFGGPPTLTSEEAKSNYGTSLNGVLAGAATTVCVPLSPATNVATTLGAVGTSTYDTFYNINKERTIKSQAPNAASALMNNGEAPINPQASAIGSR
ncbi:MAG: hypothetical protein AABZ55_11460 [Bdellovibrionota bacterium]